MASQAGLVLTDLKFSRGQEYTADEVGLKLMTQAGYQPQAALETLSVLEKANTSGTPQFLRSHPLNRNRVESLVRRQQTAASRS